MSKNELMTMQESTFSYNFKPAEIEFNDYENLLSVAKEMAKYYENLVLKNATLTDINERHLELNNQIKALEEGRLNVKRKYNEPLNEFEKKVKTIVNTLKEPLQDIKDARDEILEAEEESRREALFDYLNRQLEDSNVRIEDLIIESSWTNKGNWTEKLNPRKKLTDEIEQHIELINEEYKRKIADREILETFLNEKGMEHEGWTSQLENRDALEIIQHIQKVEKEKKQREQEENEIAERKAQVEVETVEQPVQEVTENDEGIAQLFKEAKKPEPEIVTETIKVTGTVEQLKELSEYLTANRISYKPVVEFKYSKDDLPF